jgi:hypothetical protein
LNELSKELSGELSHELWKKLLRVGSDELREATGKDEGEG